MSTYGALFELRPWRSSDLIVDVGANDGRTVLRLRQHLPHTKIFALEPVLETFETLRSRTAGLSDVTCFRMALGAASGERPMNIGKVPALNSFHPGFQVSERIETVPVSTLDDFLAAQAVEAVQFLKIDAEGHDFEVLRGAEQTLRAGSIEVIQVEAGFKAPGVHQPSLCEISDFLAERDYHLWGIYNQCRGSALARAQGPDRPEILVYCDAIFIHARAATRASQRARADRPASS